MAKFGGKCCFDFSRWLFIVATLVITLCTVPWARAAASGAPGTPTLTQSDWDGAADYSIVMNMWWGQNGTTWQLYENGLLVHTETLMDNSPNGQTASFAFSGKPRGSYTYTNKLTNSFGATSGGTLIYTVKQGANVSVPGIPTGLTATANSSSQIAITWNPVAGATGYDLLHDGVTTASVTSPALDSGLMASSTHTYAIRAKNSAGTSAWSTIVSATTQSTNTVPGVPTGLTASANSSSQITIAWSAVAGATSYDLQRDGTTITGVSSPQVHSGLAPLSTHTYAVRAKNNSGTSAWSGSVTATTDKVSTSTLTLGQVASPNGRYYSGYYPTWSDNWFTVMNWDGTKKTDNEIYTASNLAKVPGVYTHVMLAFGQPNFSWGGIAANSWSGTGLNFNATPADIKEVIRLLHILKKKVILAVGGATYNNWAGLANEAGKTGSSAPIKSALTSFIVDMGVDGLDVDFEIMGADAATVNQYANAIQAMREATDAAGPGHLLTVAAWSTGADYSAAQSGESGYPGTPTYWGGAATRERQSFHLTVGSGPLAGRSVISLFDCVNIMAYDAQTNHYDPVTAYDQYRALAPANVVVSVGLEIPPEGWAGGILVINNSDAGVAGTIVLADQYGRTPRGPYSVERSIGHVLTNTINANPHDGAMLWEVTKTQSIAAGSAPSANSTTVAQKLATMFGYVPRGP